MTRSQALFRCTLLAVALAGSGLAEAQQDRAAERNARRAQMQMQALQQQLQQAQAEKTKVDAERAEATRKLEGQAQQVARVQSAQRATAASLKEAEAARAELVAKLADLQRTLDEQRRSTEQALAAKDTELAQAALRQKAQGEAQAVLQGRFVDQVRLVTECSDKNDRLQQLSAELLDRYRKKSVVDALKQRDPLLGLNDVAIFNLVQDYSDKADANRFAPIAERR